MTMPSSDPAPPHDPPLPTRESKPADEADSVLAGEESESESECGFCLYMKAGGCREPFIHWEKCVEEGENNNEDIVDKCHAVTKALKDCMESHPDHYGPILQAEKAAQQEAMREMENEHKVQQDIKQSDSVETVQLEEMANAPHSDHKLAF